MSENPLETQKKYSEYVDKKSPNSPILKNCFNAFLVGGIICTIGQLIFDYCSFRGADIQTSNLIVSIILIFTSAFLTAINLFNKIGKFAGAGSLVPRRVYHGCRCQNVHHSRSCTCLWYCNFYYCRNNILVIQYTRHHFNINLKGLILIWKN